jgi:ABC-type glycerol-3-phosphate transport system substrate-binding protein
MLDEVSAVLSDTIKITPRFHVPRGGIANFEQELKKLIDSGEQVDAFTVDALDLFSEETLLDITEIFRDYAPDYYSELVSNDYGMRKLEKASINGRLYCIPDNEVIPPRYCVIARKDLVNKYAPGGIETLENYADFLKAVKENEKSIIPGYVQARDFFDAYLEGNGYYTLFDRWLPSRWDDNQPSFYRIDKTPEFRQAFELLEDLNKNGCIFGDSFMISVYRFALGNLASELRDMHENSIWNLSFAGVQEEYEVFPLYMDSIHALSTSTYSIGISKSCRHPERVMMFIEWLHSSQEAYNLFMYGVKDRNYILQDGKIGFTADIKQNYYIGGWLGSWYFKDMRYERKFAYLPGNYNQLYIDAAFANTKSVRDEKTRLGLSSELGEEVRERINQGYEQVSDIQYKVTNEIYAFYARIDKGRFDMTPGMLTGKLDGIGIEEYQEYLEYYISEAKQE